MLTKDFHFDLPQELVAQRPSGTRGQDRLMVLERGTGSVSHRMMDDLPSLVPQNALMVFNNSRVRRSRVYGTKESTGRECEFLFISPSAPESGGGGFRAVWRTMARNAKKQRAGCTYVFPDGTRGTIIGKDADQGTEFRTLGLDRPADEGWFERNGHIPLPPYIRRKDTEEDGLRYQNVYATETGSSACPTAGLHFTQEMLDRLKAAGIQTAWLTLHVGLGTFLPVRARRVEEHKMHSESYSVSGEAARLVTEAKRSGRPILAVGTTSVRTLESAWDGKTGTLRAGAGSTSIFMYPGYSFKVVDKLFTNFHTPESTLLMLVSAFAGRDAILGAYRTAVESRYRFFSYGDAMLIL